MAKPDWQWDEMQQIGTDYDDQQQVADYDMRMAEVRDVDAENAALLEQLDLAPGSSVLEIGCGTGRFARAAAAAGHDLTAIDVSAPMLAYVRDQAAQEGLPDIATQHAGFLTMDFPANTFDAAVSSIVLHHLPDAWKLIALRNVARVLRPGAVFFLRDAVFSTAKYEPPENAFKGFVQAFPTMPEEAACHVAQEFSTYDWIMEGLLERAGFTIQGKEESPPAFVSYHCTAEAIP